MAQAHKNMKIDGDRLWQSLMAMAEIGPGVAGSNNRQALTDADGEARHLFQQWCEDAGLTMSLTRWAICLAGEGLIPCLADHGGQPSGCQ